MKIGDKVIFKKGDWADHLYIDNTCGIIIELDTKPVHASGYIIEWNILGKRKVQDFFNYAHINYLHYDLKRIRNEKLKELGIC